MYLIAKQPYIRIQREVINLEQKEIEKQFIIYLYRDEIITEHFTFAIEEVLDMSYRNFGDKVGILYLHTIKGVYPYTVKTSPQKFIEAFLKNKEEAK